MATCAMLGQAVGTAVAQAVQNGNTIREVNIDALQQTLLYDDCFLPGIARVISPLTKRAKTNTPVVVDGHDRPDGDSYHGYIGALGDAIELAFDQPVHVQELRLIFDSNLNRRHHNMPCCYSRVECNYRMPQTLVKSYRIEVDTLDGKTIIAETENNRKRMVCHSIDKMVSTVRLIPLDTWGDAQARVFSLDVK